MRKCDCTNDSTAESEVAEVIEQIREYGYRIESKKEYCPICNAETVHYRLILPRKLKLPAKLRKRVLQHYNNTEAITLRQMLPNQLEVDHRFPQVRWAQDEIFDPDMPGEQLRRKFQLLTRAHNLWKSRYCEHCKQTGERGTFIGINYFYEGDEMWDKNIANDDERGCLGCFWYDPETWRNRLNSKLREDD